MVELRKCVTAFMLSIVLFSNLAVKIWFLLLKSPTLEHTLAKQISCDIQKHEKGSEEHLHPEMGLMHAF